mmetsp:Transcript_5864/g.14947  ORF Transcript_5864/g.14947 Transcript_5864/m.14947 type:complete len:259 (+) Transcript_5864:2283-3059(+)
MALLSCHHPCLFVFDSRRRLCPSLRLLHSSLLRLVACQQHAWPPIVVRLIVAWPFALWSCKYLPSFGAQSFPFAFVFDVPFPLLSCALLRLFFVPPLQFANVLLPLQLEYGPLLLAACEYAQQPFYHVPRPFLRHLLLRWLHHRHRRPSFSSSSFYSCHHLPLLRCCCLPPCPPLPKRRPQRRHHHLRLLIPPGAPRCRQILRQVVVAVLLLLIVAAALVGLLEVDLVAVVGVVVVIVLLAFLLGGCATVWVAPALRL